MKNVCDSSTICPLDGCAKHFSTALQNFIQTRKIPFIIIFGFCAILAVASVICVIIELFDQLKRNKVIKKHSTELQPLNS